MDRKTNGIYEDNEMDDGVVRGSRDLFVREDEESVEPNPTFRRMSRSRSDNKRSLSRSKQSKSLARSEHPNCELCMYEGEVFVDTRRSKSRSRPTSRTRQIPVDDYEDEERRVRTSKTKPKGAFSKSPLRTSVRKEERTFTSPQRKQIRFTEQESPEFRPVYNIYKTKSGVSSIVSPLRQTEDFARSDTPPLEEDTEDIEEGVASPIPAEGNKGSIKSTRFSATKDKTRATTAKSFISASGRGSSPGSRHNHTFYSQLPGSSTKNWDSNLKTQTRTGLRKTSLKVLAQKLKKYALLEQEEMHLKNKLFKHKNYNADIAFELLSPVNGVVNTEILHKALTKKLGITAVEKSIVTDIIERLAYEHDQELVLSDMRFFEPTEDDKSYHHYLRNVNKPQDSKDKSWHPIFKQLWKALINTVKHRRIIQKEMSDNYPNAVDYMFSQCSLRKTEKLEKEDIEDFLHEQLKVGLNQELLNCLIQTLDRDQDGKVSHQEL